MRPALVVAIAVAIAAAAASAAYLALSAQGGPAAALRNAAALASRNITATYELSAGLAGPRASPLFPRYVRGLVTISRTPVGDAAVVNGTVAVQAGLVIFRAGLDLALWRSGEELCYGFKLASIRVADCVPYLDLAQEYRAMLNESRYIGEGTWRGETTYCFAATASATARGEPLLINASKLCLLQNGVPANATLYIYPDKGPTIAVNLTLVNYAFAFNQGAFAEITGGLVPTGK
nr:MAG: hypothetical protein TU35_09395 [Thermoproteus sp. AZ2]